MPQSAVRPQPCPPLGPPGPPEPPLWGRVLRLLLHLSFCVLARACLRMHIRGLEHLRNLPGSIILGTHQSGYDFFAGLSTILLASRFRGPLSRISVVATEMAFEPGVFAAMGVQRPPWLSRLVYRFNLGRVMRAMRYYPIPMGHRRFLRSHLVDVVELLGNLPLKDVFRDSPELFFPSLPPETPVGAAICWDNKAALYRLEPFSVFRPEIEEVLRQRHRPRIADSLAQFASLLDRGEAIAIAPGGLSRDGRMRNIKSGALQILQQTQRESVLIPLNLTYDFMTTGRIRAFITFGPPLLGVRDYDRQRYETEVGRTLAGMSVITFGQVAARAILRHAADGRNELPEDDLNREVHTEIRSLANRGLQVDPLLLEERGYERRWRRFLAYCRRQGLFEIRNGFLRFDPAQLLDGAWSGRLQAHPWIFSANELDSILSAVEEIGK